MSELTLNFRIKADGSGLVAVSRDATQQLQSVSGAANNAAKGFTGIERAVGSLRTAVATLGLAAAAREIIQVSDAYAGITGRLKLVSDGAADLAAKQERLFGIAQQTGSAYEGVASLYTKVARNASALGLAQQQVYDLTLATNEAIQVGGATASEAAAGVLQFSQSLASGVLRGDEFNSVMENMPRLALAIAAGLGVSIGQLRAMAEAGTLTADVVSRSLLSQKGVIEREFSALPVTVGRAITELQNAVQRAVASGDMQPLVQSVRDLAQVVSDPQVIAGVASIASGVARLAGDVARAAAAIAGNQGLRSAAESLGPPLRAVATILEAVATVTGRAIEKAVTFAGYLPIFRLAGEIVGALNQQQTEAAQRAAQTAQESAQAAASLKELLNLDVGSGALPGFAAQLQAASDVTVPLRAGMGATADAIKLVDAAAEKARKTFAEQTAIQERTLELMRQGMNASVAQMRAQAEADGIEQAAIARRAKATQGLEDYKTAAEQAKAADEAFREAVKRDVARQQDEEDKLLNLRLQTAALRDRLSLMAQGVSAEDAAYQSQMLQLRALEAAKLAQGSLVQAAQTREQIEQLIMQRQIDAAGRLDAFFKQNTFASRAAEIRDALGSIGDPIAGLIDAFETLGVIAERTAQAIADSKTRYGEGTAAQLAAESAALKKQSEAQIGVYGDMAGAASKFFKQGSDGYRALQAVSTAFHAVELANTIATLVPKGIAAVLSQGEGDPYTAPARMAAMAAIVAGLGVAIGGVSGGSSTYTPPDSGAGAGKGTVLGDSTALSESISNALDQLVGLQDKGLAVSNAQLSALRAIQAGINGVGTLLYRQNAGTGATPFAFTATSRANSSYGMADAFEMMRNSPTFDAVSKIPLLGDIQNMMGSLISGAMKGFFGSTKQKQVDSGILIDAAQSLGDMLADGLDATYYATIQTTKKKYFGLSKRTSYDDVTAPLSNELSKQFKLVVQGLNDSVLSAAGFLGADFSVAQAAIKSLLPNIGKISLEGLTATEAQSKLSAVFSNLGDQMASSVANALLPGLSDLQQAGEGLYETLIRVASQTAAVDHVLANMGASVNSAYAALAGMDRAKVADNLIQLAGGIDQFASNVNSFMDKFLSDDEKLAAQKSNLLQVFSELGLTLPATADDLKTLVRGLDLTSKSGAEAFTTLTGLSEQLAGYYDALAAAQEAEQQRADAVAQQRAGLQQQLDQLLGNTAAIRARELAALDPANRALQQRIYALQDEQAAEQKAAQVAQQRAGLQQQLDQLMGNTAAIRARELAALDPANRALQQRIYALQDQQAALEAAKQAEADRTASIKSSQDALRSAYQTQAGALRSLVDKSKASVASLRALQTQLTSGSAAMLSPEAQYQALKQQLQTLAPMARLGDENAVAQLQAVAKDFLDASAAVNASSAAYFKDRDLLTSIIGNAISAGSAAQDVAQQQLDALTSQVSALIDINDSVLSVADAVKALAAAMKVGPVTPHAVGGVFSNGIFTGPTYFNRDVMGEADPEAVMPLAKTSSGKLGVVAVGGGGNNQALVEELRALRAEAERGRLTQAEGFRRMLEQLAQHDLRLRTIERAAQLEMS